ncbi:hypothetical protein EZS27_005309 [termite gut metagenome]|uniref:DUF5119 domain-containing protein n=1 Tax=termite gut metagenome TaxID=433724 RepID=A0A5J4SLV5_9ZZZZ
MKIAVQHTHRALLIITTSLLVVLSSCVIEEPLYETDHPEYGVVTLTTNWDNRTDGVAIPEKYLVRIGEDYNHSFSNVTNEIDYLFSQGVYPVYIYNETEEISIKGESASVSVDKDGYTKAQPGWFFTGSDDIRIAGDTDELVTVYMQQQIRQLSFVFSLVSNRADKLTRISAVLTGAGGSLNIDRGVVTGGSVNVQPVFEKQPSGAYRATVRLLGVAGNVQSLRLTLFFSEGSPNEVTASSDLSERLVGFNEDKKTPLTLSAQIVEIQTPIGGFTASFSDWIEGEEEIVVEIDD